MVLKFGSREFFAFRRVMYYCIPSSSNDKFNISKQLNKSTPTEFEVLNAYFEILFYSSFKSSQVEGNGNGTLKEKETTKL